MVMTNIWHLIWELQYISSILSLDQLSFLLSLAIVLNLSTSIEDLYQSLPPYSKQTTESFSSLIEKGCPEM